MSTRTHASPLTVDFASITFILLQVDALGLGDRLVVDVHTDGFHGVEAAGEVWKEKATKSWSVLNPETFVLYTPMVFKSQSIVQV